MSVRVLIVDDEPQIRRALSLNLGVRGYEVFQAASGEAAITAVASDRPDIVLLDLGLPKVDGSTVLAALRGWTTLPVIVLTARDDERSKIELLDAGADDYISKPFGMGELISRMNAVLRRASPEPRQAAVVETDHFRLDLAAHRAFVGEREVRLTPIEWAIVAHLVRHSDRLITYDQMFTAVWGPHGGADGSLLRVHMSHIRQKLEPEPARPRYFLTNAGSGYLFQSP